MARPSNDLTHRLGVMFHPDRHVAAMKAVLGTGETLGGFIRTAVENEVTRRTRAARRAKAPKS